MARTLVIGNADFSVNKFDTVTFTESKPCTAISLDKSTDSITSISGTSTLTATKTPADTTDSVIWSSSDSDVATVANGVVTAIGCGTAVITATCGEQSDTCTVTVTHVATLGYAIDKYLGKGDSKDYLDGGTLANYAIGFSETGDTRRVSYDNRTEDRYPYVIPKGATKIEISCTNFKPYGFWMVSTERSSLTATVALALTKDSFGSAQSSYGSRSVTIPAKSGDYAEMDSVAFVFQFNGTIEESSTDEITVTFTA